MGSALSSRSLNTVPPVFPVPITAYLSFCVVISTDKFLMKSPYHIFFLMAVNQETEIVRTGSVTDKPDVHIFQQTEQRATQPGGCIEIIAHQGNQCKVFLDIDRTKLF